MEMSTTGTCPSTPTTIPITRSDPNSPYPTTFVTADTTSFKQVVQMLTGSSEPPTPQNDAVHLPPPTPPSRTFLKQKQQQQFKLYERRNTFKNNNSNSLLMINPLQNASFYPSRPDILSPSVLDFPSLTLSSPVTPLSAAESSSTSSEEERAIAEKGFYFHPSPRDAEPPQLLPLFPLTSPRLSDPS